MSGEDLLAMPEPISAPFTRYIGAIAEEIGEGGVRLSVQTGPQHADRWGRVHAGVLTSVMDSVIGIGLGRARGEGARDAEGPHATIDMSTSFYATATPGDEIVAEGSVLRIDGPVAFGEVDARRRSDGELLAKARLTFVIPGARR
jgi:acyl-coenzyme A thioesterase PaaI-like protein